MNESNQTPKIIQHVASGQMCCDPDWEAAYKRFETPEEEIAKFIGRLKRFGFESLPKDARINEIFCGRGGGLVALERLGFTDVEGTDLSDTLLAEYRGAATLHLADCLCMPFDDDSYDIVIVQGGLHHLPKIPDDLDRCLAEVKRILKPDGTFYVIEPWRTPFLNFVHFVTDQPIMRKLYAKGDALAAMTECERVTYENWLTHPKEIMAVFDSHFKAQKANSSWGKLAYAGTPIS
ncbi:Demethylmenaquinone methyltransferase [Rubripirellula obstinata]|uniref:Demethylmenaquinone methyltransferase n=1 Tax=Rubripirellula obstinata TaxID=406547 RepID=A0A5B1CGP2_9BACT|nr:class I SAM-dependent methyltransferase [Rubripirellula obstinata]KAA1260367.1 Demethylmenaquinone methyltransferase [Rubripirellula obstinata]